MLQNPTHEAIKMNVYTVSCDAESFQNTLHGLFRVIGGRSLKNSNIWHRKLSLKCQNFKVFSIWRAIARAILRARSWKCWWTFGLIKTFILSTSYVGFWSIGQPLTRNQSTSPPEGNTLDRAILISKKLNFLKLWKNPQIWVGNAKNSATSFFLAR